MHAHLGRRSLLKLAAASSATLAVGQVALVAHASTPPEAPQWPDAGTWRTWFIASAEDLPVPPPPDSRAELAAVRSAVDQVDDATRDRIDYWAAGAPPYRWNELATDMFFRGAFGPNPVQFQRVQAYMNTAIHDATVAAWSAKYAYNRSRPSDVDATLTPLLPVPNSPAYPAEHAAAAAAASEVLAYFAPDQAELLRRMADEASQSRLQAGLQYPSDVAAGMDLGKAAAAQSIQTARSDNYDTATWDGVIPEGPGLWKGTNPVGVTDRFLKPFIVPSADALRPPPPPAYDSPERASEVDAVKNFPRTPVTNGLAFWVQYQLRGAPNFNIIYNRDVSRLVFEERLQDSPLPARIYALLHTVYQDAWITTQDTKFTYWTARPSMFDPSITTLFPNPPHPSYVSNGSALATSPSLIISHFFPRDAAQLIKRANEWGDARLWAGIHFPSDIQTSRQMGEQLAALALARDAG